MIARIRPETRYLNLFRSLYAGTVYQNMLEEQLKAFFGVEEVLLTHGGRVGLYYLLKALPHKKVYLPAYTCWAVPDAIKRAGKELAYVDIKLEDYNIDVEKLNDCVTPGSIILATHQFGIPCDIEALKTIAGDKNCLILEDNAAGFGSTFKGQKTGSFAPASIISFEFSKTLTCGKGGAVLFNDRDLSVKVKQIHERETRHIRYHEILKHLSSLAGYLLMTNQNFYAVTHWLFDKTKGTTTGYPPPDSDEANIDYRPGFDKVRAKLAHYGMMDIDRVIARRSRIAKFYLEELAACEKVALPAYPDDKSPVFMRFPVRVRAAGKAAFYKQCVKKKVDLAFTFSYSCAPDIEKFPHAVSAAETVLNLPVYSKLTDNDLQKIKDVIVSI
jgi:dTDP-4-amino-4,6-dideoxygalactose transaminase